MALNLIVLCESISEAFLEDLVKTETGFYELELEIVYLNLPTSFFWIKDRFPFFGWPEFGLIKERFSFLPPNIVLNDFEFVVRICCLADRRRLLSDVRRSSFSLLT